MPTRSGRCILAKVRETSAGSDRRVSRLTTTIVMKASGTVTAAGYPTRVDGQPPAASSPTQLVTASRAAIADVEAPTARPATAPAAVSPRHQMPSTSNGHSVEAATANTNPTPRDNSNDDAASAKGTGINPPITAAIRKSRTPPRSSSVEAAPAMLTSSPDDVARNAAMAPAATRAPSSWPPRPAIVADGKSSTAASALPVTSNCGR